MVSTNRFWFARLARLGVGAIVLALLSAFGAIWAPPAQAQSFTNSRVADAGLSEVGTRRAVGWDQPGECIKSAQRWVAAAGGQFGGGGVLSGYQNSGAKRVDLSQTVKGDVLQYTNGNDKDWSRVHTVVVVANKGGGLYSIVQSNGAGYVNGVWRNDGSGLVTTNPNWKAVDPRTGGVYTGWYWTAWRFGTVGNPFGALDQAKAVAPGTISVQGWAADPQLKAGPLSVHIYADSTYVGALTANKLRSDVQRAFPGYGAYLGYSATIQLKLRGGTKNICAYGINVGSGENTQLGCRSVSVPDANPFGAFDQLTSELGDFTWRGWGVDPNKPAGPAVVSVWVNDQYTGWGYANKLRTDVAAAYPGYGQYLGFNLRTAYPAGGNIQVCVKTPNSGAGVQGQTTLGCRNISVRTRAYYFGHIVQWNGDTKAQKTAWYVTSRGTRRWIPDTRTYWCLRNHGAPVPNVLSSRALDQLPDESGVRATCS